MKKHNFAVAHKLEYQRGVIVGNQKLGRIQSAVSAGKQKLRNKKRPSNLKCNEIPNSDLNAFKTIVLKTFSMWERTRLVLYLRYMPLGTI